MMVLNVENVSKKIGRRQIINKVNLKIKEGEILGLVGPNGAGKSTLIKMITGLLIPDSGKITINNKDITENKMEAIKEIGAIIEIPEFYTYLSGKKNLMQLARLENISEDEVSEALNIVSLNGKENNKFKTYSLGMKQRLGLAQVIMGNKKLWILDEPTNGLDVNGVIEFRELLKRMAHEKGVSILISSHILGEMEKICDRIAFIDLGEIIQVENVNELFNGNCYEIYTKELIKCKNVFEENDYINIINCDDKKVIIESKDTSFEDIVKILINNSISFSDVKKKEATLESRYLEIMGRKIDD